MAPDKSFKSLAVSALRLHRWCGDAFPENGWPEVNKALAQYQKEKRDKKNKIAEVIC